MLKNLFGHRVDVPEPTKRWGGLVRIVFEPQHRYWNWRVQQRVGDSWTEVSFHGSKSVAEHFADNTYDSMTISGGVILE